MIKQLSILFLCIATVTARGQSAVDKAKIDKQINIPGTRLFINQLENFKVASNFTGLQKDNFTGLQVYDVMGGNYYTNAATFSKDVFEQQGAKVFDYKETTIGGYPAKYIHMQGDPTTSGYAVVFGDTTFCVMIMAFCPPNEAEVGNQIKKALFSVIYDKRFKVDPLATAVFTLDDSKSKFKFSRAAGGAIMYSINGIEKEHFDENEPLLMVSTVPGGNGATPSLIAYAFLNSFEKYGFTDKELKYKATDRINGYDAYEAVVYGTMKGRKSGIYQLVVLKGDTAVVIQGAANNNYDSTIQEYKELARTIKFKK